MLVECLIRRQWVHVSGSLYEAHAGKMTVSENGDLFYFSLALPLCAYFVDLVACGGVFGVRFW